MARQRCSQERTYDAAQPLQWSWCGVGSKSDCLSCCLSASRCSFIPRDRGGHCPIGNTTNKRFATSQSTQNTATGTRGKQVPTYHPAFASPLFAQLSPACSERLSCNSLRRCMVHELIEPNGAALDGVRYNYPVLNFCERGAGRCAQQESQMQGGGGGPPMLNDERTSTARVREPCGV